MERLKLEQVSLVFTNFSGDEGPYNKAGDRSFSILIQDLALADGLLGEGWALKPLKNEDDEVDAYHLPVKINYNSRTPPRIYKVNLSHSTEPLLLNSETIEMLDMLPIDYVDVIVNPYHWEVRGESGIKAYCQTMYVVIKEDDLDLKWAQVGA